MKTKLLALYGLKYNPFLPDVPVEALYSDKKTETFYWRVEQSLIREGGFALVSGDPGTGKSVVLRIMADRLRLMRDVQVGVIQHSSARLTDFYRELGDIFGISVNPNNRWCGFKNLRERWFAHLESTLLRPILFIDEAQEMSAEVLNELRLLSSQKFDSQALLSVILAGDKRLNDRLRRDDLIPLGSRIRVRLQTDIASPEQLLAILEHLLENAGNPVLMTRELMQVLCDHAAGSPRILCIMANDLLSMATMQERKQLDEQLYFECLAQPKPKTKRNSQ